jgi:mono/diheme cytochrome c family protein
VTAGFVLGVQVLVVGFLLFVFAPAIKRRWPGAEGLVALGRTAAFIGGIALVAYGASGSQTPMSNTPNPVPSQVTSVNAGYRLYQANCAACHGVDGNGGGPLAGTTEVQPPSLRAHLSDHSDGDLFYWISNGLPGGMPAWSDRLSETERWHLVNYLRSLNGQAPTPDGSASGSRPGEQDVLARLDP